MNLTPQSLVYLQVQEELKITASLSTEKVPTLHLLDPPPQPFTCWTITPNGIIQVVTSSFLQKYYSTKHILLDHLS